MLEHRLPIYYHHLYTDGLHIQARFPRERYNAIHACLQQDENKNLIQIKKAPRATSKLLKKVHDRHYVERFLSSSMSNDECRRIGLRPWLDTLIPRTLHLLGGSLAALNDAVLSGGIGANMAGGTHHAHYAAGSGYCIFNDLAVCSYVAHTVHRLKRVLIVDLDVHQGDGTATMLQNDPTTFTLSVHCRDNFPLKKATSDLDLALAAGITDDKYLGSLGTAFDTAFAFKPDIVFYQAGVDSLAQDQLGKLALTHAGLKQRNHLLFSRVAALNIPCVLFMGGGYCNPIEPTVNAFVDLFRLAATYHDKQVRALKKI